MGDVSFRPLIDDMVWSYSRLSTFDMCKYKWFLKYIEYPKAKSATLFFSAYGTFMHELIADYYSKKKTRYEILVEFLAHYEERVPLDSPPKVYESYYNKGLNYIKTIPEIENTVLAVEKKYRFNVGDLRFVGVIDRVEQDKDGNILIIDNKSKNLSPRSKRAVKSNEVLDEYLRQLYIYSIPIKELYGKYPDRLCFNCFRINKQIEEPFDEKVFNDTVEWVSNKKEEIAEETDFTPNCDDFRCKYICDMHDYCEYYRANGGGKN